MSQINASAAKAVLTATVGVRCGKEELWWGTSVNGSVLGPSNLPQWRALGRWPDPAPASPRWDSITIRAGSVTTMSKSVVFRRRSEIKSPSHGFFAHLDGLPNSATSGRFGAEVVFTSANPRRTQLMLIVHPLQVDVEAHWGRCVDRSSFIHVPVLPRKTPFGRGHRMELRKRRN